MKSDPEITYHKLKIVKQCGKVKQVFFDGKELKGVSEITINSSYIPMQEKEEVIIKFSDLESLEVIEE
ncbi:hypothetical protein [Fusobacterium ulcerans]|uniref:hypothetical protein n=1 Tax=Fusobacterium ulcerans TaxID=861 RepID=UPI003FEDB910